MKARHRRLAWIVAGLAALGVAVALVLNAFQSATSCSSSRRPQVRRERGAARPARSASAAWSRTAASRATGSLTVRFVVTDTVQTIPVVFTGLLPDLFQEGKGVVAQGKLGADGVFRASEVLAKHDENYMPPEAADAIEQAHKGGRMTQTGK